ARQEPAIAPVASAQRKGVLPGRAAGETTADEPDDALDMIGMGDFPPPPALHLGEGRAGVVVPAPVVPIDPAVGVRRPGELADVVGELGEARLAVLQRLGALLEDRLGAPAVG